MFSGVPRRRGDGTRRDFLCRVLLSGLGSTLSGRCFGRDGGLEVRRLMLGMDNFAVRAMNWKTDRLLEYAASLKLDSLFITQLDAFESLKTAYLQEFARRAAELGISVQVGSWSICPTSLAFRNDWGTAVQHLELGIRVARAVRSPIVRVVLGGQEDRRSKGGIDARIRDTIRVLQDCRSVAVDNGVKIAVENHAGDMHSSELARLIEEAGPEYVGANMDSGNALWALEDPLQNLENLGRYALCTSLRDGAVWRSDSGVTVQWTAMGEGDVDWQSYFQKFAQLCPETPVNIETISGFPHRIPIEDQNYWRAWPRGKPPGFDRFMQMAARGKPRRAWSVPRGEDRDAAVRDYQRSELERSIQFCRELGLGRNR